MNRTTTLGTLVALTLGIAIGVAQAQEEDGQMVLAPGTYTFQTRLDHSSCSQRSTSGMVTTYVAAVSGVPGAREMTMQLLNSDWWSTWTMRVSAEGHVVGDSQQDRVEGPARGDSHFELRMEDGRLMGRGSRSYMQRRNGRSQRCRMSYDALLIPLQ